MLKGVMNKNMHQESLRYIYQLNENHQETYQYVWGDKETFWIGCLLSGNDFQFNDSAGFMHNGCLTHSYKKELLWKQK